MNLDGLASSFTWEYDETSGFLNRLTYPNGMVRSNIYLPVSYTHLDVYKRQKPHRQTAFVNKMFKEREHCSAVRAFRLSLIHIFFRPPCQANALRMRGGGEKFKDIPFHVVHMVFQVPGRITDTNDGTPR